MVSPTKGDCPRSNLVIVTKKQSTTGATTNKKGINRALKPLTGIVVVKPAMIKPKKVLPQSPRNIVAGYLLNTRNPNTINVNEHSNKLEIPKK